MPVTINGTWPAFSASGFTATSVAPNTPTKMVFSGESFDTDNALSNSRFQPTISGHYQINFSVQYGGSTTNNWIKVALYKNGTQHVEGALVPSWQYAIATGSAIVYMNGSTDYLEVYGQHVSTSNSNMNAINFSGCLVRGA